MSSFNTTSPCTLMVNCGSLPFFSFHLHHSSYLTTKCSGMWSHFSITHSHHCGASGPTPPSFWSFGILVQLIIGQFGFVDYPFCMMIYFSTPLHNYLDLSTYCMSCYSLLLKCLIRFIEFKYKPRTFSNIRYAITDVKYHYNKTTL